MQDINNFKNLLHVTARNFPLLQEQLVMIPVPAQILNIGSMPNGTFYAVVHLDRPAKAKSRKPPKEKVEIVDNSIV